jgi:hypothetical protein
MTEFGLTTVYDLFRRECFEHILRTSLQHAHLIAFYLCCSDRNVIPGRVAMMPADQFVVFERLCVWRDSAPTARCHRKRSLLPWHEYTWSHRITLRLSVLSYHSRIHAWSPIQILHASCYRLQQAPGISSKTSDPKSPVFGLFVPKVFSQFLSGA